MAKESVKARQRKREKMVAKFADKRAALKEAGDWQALDQLPKNSSKEFLCYEKYISRKNAIFSRHCESRGNKKVLCLRYS
jgi:small subunit ribosomal protein S14